MSTFPTSRHVLEPDCERCPVLVTCRERISWGTGSLDADVMVVGEAPGSGNPDADRWRGGNWTGRAYTTRHSGRRIRTLFSDLGYEPYYTNAVKCYPCDGEGGNRPPTDEELATCRSHLEAELETVEPSVIVTTGSHATRTVLAFCDRTIEGFLDHVLEPIELDAIGPSVLPILHPSYQDVWIGRLGYEPEAYERAIKERLNTL